MLDRPRLHNTFNRSGVILILFNALALDLLVVGYGGQKDLSELTVLLSNITLRSFFELSLLILLSFVIYTLLFKELLIWILAKAYYLIVLGRVITYPFLKVGYNGSRAKKPFSVARNDWREFCNYQLNMEENAAQWTFEQHMAVATFFLFLVSLAAPFFGFQSIGYRVLPEVLFNSGVHASLHWLGYAVCITAVCYTCSNGMLALFGSHQDRFVPYYNRKQNAKLLEIIDDMRSSYKKALSGFREIETKLSGQSLGIKMRGFKEAVSGAIDATTDLDSTLKELREKIEKQPEGSHHSIARILRGFSEAYVNDKESDAPKRMDI